MEARTVKSAAPKQTLIIGETGRQLTFEAIAKLSKPAATRQDMDIWAMLLSCDGGEAQSFEYRTGTGHRVEKTSIGFPTRIKFSGRGDLADTMPVQPMAKDLLICLGSDVSTALEMPRDDVKAMDYLQSEFGNDGKGSELLVLVRALRLNADKIETLLRGTGVTVQQFAEACQQLDQ